MLKQDRWILLLFALLVAHGGLLHAQNKESDRQQLLQLKRDWGRTYVEHDERALERFLAPEYVLVDDNGKPSTREQVIRDSHAQVTAYELATYDDARMLVYGR